MEMKSVLMVGQSNMAGRGDFGEVPEINNPNCFMLRNGRWQPMREPINVDRPIWCTYHSGIGLAASFADCLAKKLNCGIGLIPCADGGTKVEQWQPHEILFDHAVMQAKLAMRSSELIGIIWHQGEGNSNHLNCDDYAEKLKNVVNGFRAELGNETLPFIMGEISEDISSKWNVPDRHQMNLLLKRLSGEIPHTALASSEGLTLKPDGIHFCSAACRTFGIRYYEKFMESF